MNILKCAYCGSTRSTKAVGLTGRVFCAVPAACKARVAKGGAA